jgi:hypothetical protein
LPIGSSDGNDFCALAFDPDSVELGVLAVCSAGPEGKIGRIDPAISGHGDAALVGGDTEFPEFRRGLSKSSARPAKAARRSIAGIKAPYDWHFAGAG